jgi:hypothetical protein
MATRSIKDAPRYIPGRSPIQVGPSPFPLLILALLIMVIFMIKLRAEENPSFHVSGARSSLHLNF